jgi:WD40 repeat protein
MSSDCVQPRIISLCGGGVRVRLAVTADGTRIVSGGDDGTVRVWDAETGSAAGKPL